MTTDALSSIKNISGLELKTGSFTLLRLCMSDLDTEAIDALLCDRVSRTPEFFHNTPVVLDLSVSNDEVPQGNLAVAIGAIRGYGMIPIGVRGGSKKLQEQAKLLELALFSGLRRPSSNLSKPLDQDRITKVKASKVVDTPVRSGQRIYAQGRDLILLAAVSSGAEVVADGNVHAYAPIRGRVLAGVKGDKSASIYCKDLKAELISIAGRYKVSEELSSRHMGHFVSVSLRGDAFVFKEI
ncbi:MAG: septum site-determining protein MinC [Candidatus Thiodiazotropha sp. LLP2]